MNHDNVCTTIKELLEKVEAIRAEMLGNRGGRHYSGLATNEPGNDSRARGERNRELKLEKADVFDDLGRAWRQKGNEGNAKYYFDEAKNLRKEVNDE